MEIFYHAYVSNNFKFLHHCLSINYFDHIYKRTLKKISRYSIELDGIHCLQFSRSLSKKEGMHVLLISVFVKTNLDMVIFFRLWSNAIHVTFKDIDYILIFNKCLQFTEDCFKLKQFHKLEQGFRNWFRWRVYCVYGVP